MRTGLGDGDPWNLTSLDQLIELVFTIDPPSQVVIVISLKPSSVIFRASSIACAIERLVREVRVPASAR
jgi:hypothetical protein